MDNSDLGRSVPDGLSSATPIDPLRVSPVPASIPSAMLEAIARIIDPYIAKLTDKSFTSGHLLSALRYDQDRRSVAVAAIDRYHGFTYEFSPWPQAHVEQYDMLEALIAFGDAVTGGLTAVEAYLNAPAGERLAHFFLAEDLAQAIETRRAATGTGAVHENAVGETDAPTPSSEPRLSTLGDGE